MDKNKIKSHLHSFLAEADKKHIGLSSTEKVQNKEKSVNKDYYKEVVKKMGEYDKESTDDKDSIAKGKLEKTDSEEMDVNPNGMDQIQYDNDPGEKFKQRAIDALEGTSKMGNKTYDGKWDPSTGTGNGNTEEVWGSSGGKHTGKEIVKAAKAVSKKDARPQEDGVGYVPSPSKTKLATENKVNKNTLSESIKWDIKNISGHADELSHMTHFGIHKPTNSIVGFWDYPDEDPEDLKLDKDLYFFTDIKDTHEGNVDKYKKGDFLIVTKKGLQKRGIDLNNYPRFQGQDYEDNEVTNHIGENKINNNEIIKESKMKRLKFNESFNGLGGALQKIPAKYKVDNKVFEMTDGNENYRIKWEGSLTEGEAVVLIASDKKMMNEDIQQMKHLMGFKAEDTLGTPSAKDRLSENTTFRDIMNMTNTILTEGVNEDGDRKPLNETAFAGGAGMGFSNESNLEGGEPLAEMEIGETEVKEEYTRWEDMDDERKEEVRKSNPHVDINDDGTLKTEDIAESEDVMEGFESPAVFSIAEADNGSVMNDKHSTEEDSTNDPIKLKQDVAKLMDKLDISAIRPYLKKIDNAVEQAEVIGQFSELIGVPKAKLSMVVAQLRTIAENDVVKSEDDNNEDDNNEDVEIEIELDGVEVEISKEEE